MGRRAWFGLVAISVAVALIIVDSTIVNVAVPDIVAELDLTSTDVQWVQESYTLVFASLLLFFGVLGDRVGRRRMLLIGVTVFALSSVAAAFASSAGLLIGTRIVQGIGGAIILPTTLSLLNATFTGRARGIAFAVWGSTIGGMAAVGPLLGGWLTTDFSWRWAFGINLPLGVLIVVGVLLWVRESRSEHPVSLDPVGAVLVTLGLATLTFGLIEGRNYGWWGVEHDFVVGAWTWPFDLSPVPVAFAVSALALAGFGMWALLRLRAGRGALLDLRLYRIASFRNGSVVAAVVSLGEFGIILSLPIWLQNVLGLSAFGTGLVLLALAVGSFVASGLAATVGQRMRAVDVVRAGLVAEILGVGAIGLAVWLAPGWGWLLPALFVYGVGVGLATAQLTGVVLQDVPVASSGAGSGAQSTARQLGSALGIAILGTVLYTTAAGSLTAALDEQGVPASARDGVIDAVVESSGGAIAELETDPRGGAEAADAARAAFTDGTRNSAFVAAGALVLGLAATVTLGGRRERR